MSVRTFVYQSRFNVPAPPVEAEVAAQFVGAFGQYPSVTGVTLVFGAAFNAVGPIAAPVVVPFQAGEAFPDIIAKAPQAPASSSGFVQAAKPITFAIGRSPDVFLSLRKPLEGYSFVFTAAAAVATPGPFSFTHSPAALAARRPPLENYSLFPLFPPVAAAVAAQFVGAFGQYPSVTGVTFALGAVFGSPVRPAAAAIPVLGFGSQPAITRRPIVRGMLGWVVSPTAARTTPGPLSFSQHPHQVLPPRALPSWVGFVTAPIAAALRAAGEFPDLLPSPPRATQIGAGFVPVITVAATPGRLSFTHSPHVFVAARRPLESYTWIGLQIAYTPRALGFSQYPERFQAPVAASLLNTGVPGFEFLPTVASTPTPFQFSQHPPAFAYPHKPFETYVFWSTFRIAATPTAQGFSQDPERFQLPIKASLLNLNTSGFVFVPPFIVTTPAEFQFSQHPPAFAYPHKPFETYVFWSTFRIAAIPVLGFGSQPAITRRPIVRGMLGWVVSPTAARTTPGPLSFSQHPHQVLPPRALPSWVGSAPYPQLAVAAVTLTAFGEFPDLLQRPRSWIFDRNDAPAPKPPIIGNFGFGEFPDLVARRSIPIFDRSDFALVQIAYTPRPFQFSQHPVLFAYPRKPGLDRYLFWSTFRIAVAPSAFQFSQHPIATLKFPDPKILFPSGSFWQINIRLVAVEFRTLKNSELRDRSRKNVEDRERAKLNAVLRNRNKP